MKIIVIGSLLLLASCFTPASAWDNDDLEIFDLVELINQNFYTVLGISQARSCYVDMPIESVNKVSFLFLISGCNFSRS